MKKSIIKQPKYMGRCGFGNNKNIVDTKITMMHDCFECDVTTCKAKKILKRLGGSMK